MGNVNREAAKELPEIEKEKKDQVDLSLKSNNPTLKGGEKITCWPENVDVARRASRQVT